ncbi:C-4 sterol methyl oxidase [Borealophlyctis nickersoniae]|nr:C-4 sterol methyl oxidase [Borealophlyctis nickersoniae]
MAEVFTAAAALNGTSSSYEPNYLERQWLNLFDGSDYTAIRLALVLFAWHEFVFFGRFLPYYICDFIPYFRKYKIQDVSFGVVFDGKKDTTPEMYWKCIREVIRGQLTIQLPMIMLFHPVAMWMGMKFLDVPFPSWGTIAASCAFCLVCEDTYHYFAHRLLHYGSLYKNIHKLHHEYSAPFGIAAEYAHPLEVLITGQGFFIGPALLLLMGIDMHVITMAAWLAVRLICVVDVHSGYDFPWALRKILPFWGGADFHDYHHMAFVGNYSSTFRHWDWIFGTDKGYNQWKERVETEGKKAK